MSWQGQVNKPIGVAGIDSNGKIHALDGSQLFNLNATNISSGNVPTANLPNGGVNGVSQLVQLDASGKLPALDASALTSLSAANISGTLPNTSLPKATTSDVGVVQVGSNINVSAGVISVPAATTSALGLIQPDGVTINVVGGLLVAGAATSAANVTGGSAGDIVYQTATNTTGFLSAANGVLVGNGGTPSYTTTPTLVGTNFSGIPNSATTATSANTASAIVARDSNGDFTARNVTVTGSLIGSASSYNAFDPTIITSSSTLTTDISMIIATGAGGYTTTLPEASTFPVSQLGKPIYYINSATTANTVEAVGGGGFITVDFSIIGATTAPPLYALDATSLPTVSNMTISGNVATATTNNASAQTFDYVAANNITQVTPKMKFTNGNILSVDPTSTTGSTKFNYSTTGAVTVGSKVQVDVGGTVSEITVGAGSQSGNAAATGLFSVASANGVIFILNTTTGKLWTSQDTLITISATTLTSSVLTSITNAAYFNNVYYISGFCSGLDGIIYQSSDLTNWSIADTLAGYPRSVVMSNGSILSCAYGKNVSNLLTIRTSTNGTLFTTQTTTLGIGTTLIRSGQYQNGSFLIHAYQAILNSTDGINYTLFNTGGDPGYGLGKFGSYFIVNQQNNSILYTTNFNSWGTLADGTNRGSVVGQISVNTANTKVCIVAASGTAYYSTTGINYSSISIGTGYTPVGSNNGQTCAVVGDTIINATTTSNKLNISYDFGLTWTSLDLSTTSAGFQFTMTSPSIAVPTWAALGGQTMQYSVSATSTPSFTSATTPTYTRVGNEITTIYSAVTPTAASHLQLKALTLNSGDVLKEVGANLRVLSNTFATIPSGGKYALIPTSTAGWQSFQFA